MVTVNMKGVPQYEVRNVAVYFVTTNEYSGIAMDDVERRNVVFHFTPTVHYDGGTAWWNDYMMWLELGGYGHIRYWLEHRSISKFDPNFMPEMTAVKAKMVSASRSDEENWIYDLFSNPDVCLGSSGRSVYTTDELYFLYSSAPGDNHNLRSFARFLGNKFDQAHGGKLMKIFDGRSPVRMWKVKNRDQHWGPQECKADVAKFPVIKISN
jgi:hypothetical protein